MGQGDSVKSRGKERKSGRQCKEEGSAAGVWPAPVTARPTDFPGLREVQKPKPRARPLPHPTPRPRPLIPIPPQPSRSLPGFPSARNRSTQSPGFHRRVLRRELTRR